MTTFALDVSHLLAGSLVLLSFMMLYQDRMFGLINVFALHAVALVLAMLWQGYIQNAPISVRHRDDRPGDQGRDHSDRAAADRRPARRPPHDRDRGRYRPDDARRHRACRALDGGDARGHIGVRSAGARGPGACAFGDPARPPHDGVAPQCGHAGDRLHVDRERPDPRRRRRAAACR